MFGEIEPSINYMDDVRKRIDEVNKKRKKIIDDTSGGIIGGKSLKRSRYCRSCQTSPCMCSDPFKTNPNFD